MLVFIDDGSTNIKLQWQESDGTIKQHISPNSFKRALLNKSDFG